MSNLTKEDIEQVKKAAGKGTMRSTISLIILRVVTIAILIVAVSFLFRTKKTEAQKQFSGGANAVEHDLVLKDEGKSGYTAADFAEAILGNQEEVAHLVVLENEVSDTVTLTDTGFLNLNVFTKTQNVKYEGIARYYVDLTNIETNDISVNNNEVTVYIPHAQLESVEINPDNVKYEDIEKGWLAFGEIEISPEEMTEVESEVKNKMEAKLIDENVSEDADENAKDVVKSELQQIFSRKELGGYSVEVEFKE